MQEIKSICVYCASSSKVDACYSDAAYTLGTIIGREVNLSKTDVSGTHFADMWVRLV